MAPRINSPDQRLRVFVSSTLQELAPERAAARAAIARLRLTPVLFEQGARPYPPRVLYRQYLAQSDLFIGIYWQRYGWVAPGEPISGLEDEYRLSAAKPRLLYIKEPAAAREPGLTALLQRIALDDTASYRRFATAEELGDLIENDVAVLLSEHFVQAASDAHEGVAPPAGHRAALPAQRGPLFGREREMATVAALLRRPDVGLVTLTGPGGTGKTRLAIAAAHALAGHFADGVAFVSLASITDPALVASAIGAALGIREERGQPVLRALHDALRDRHLLLLLDNFEQVIAAAPLVGELLAGAAHLTVLATSRTALRLNLEKDIPIAPLAVPAREELAARDTVGQSGAVRLFVERAHDTSPDFALTEENARAVGEICVRLDGLPLAIELAAARLRVLTPAALLARLGRRLPLLSGGARDLPARQRTLRATIEWSCSLLSPEEATLYRRLAVFAGGFFLDAAEAVCGAAGGRTGAVLDGLASLVDQSLVQQGEAAEGLRFSLLGTIREYGMEQLAQRGEAADVQRRYSRYFVDLAERLERTLLSEGPACLARLELERDNLQAALHWSLADGGDLEAALRLVGALAPWWFMGGHLTEGRRWVREALARRDARRHPAAYAGVLLAAGSLAVAQGDPGAARPWLTEGTERLEKERMGAGGRRALALLWSGLLRESEGDAAGALAHVEGAARLFRASGSRWGEATAGAIRADALLLLGDMAGARATAAHSLATFRDLGEPWGIARSLAALAGVAWLHGEDDRALAHYKEAADLFRKVGDRWDLARVLSGLGASLLRAGRYDEAAAALQEGLAIWRDLDNRSGLLLCLAALARAMLARGQTEAATGLLGAVLAPAERGTLALDTVSQIQFRQVMAELRGQRGDGAAEEGEAMTLEAAVGHALSGLFPRGATSQPDMSSPRRAWSRGHGEGGAG